LNLAFSNLATSIRDQKEKEVMSRECALFHLSADIFNVITPKTVKATKCLPRENSSRSIDTARIDVK
jgi:hypothetical protein